MKHFAKFIPFLFIGVFCQLVSAQASLSPLYVDLDLEQTGQAQATFTVFNGTSTEIRYRARFLPFNYRENITLLENGEQSKHDLSIYLRAAPLEFEIPAGGEQVIRVIALVPPSKFESELRAALVLEPLIDENVSATQSSSSDVTARVLYTYRFIAQIYAKTNDLKPALSIRSVKYSQEKGLQLLLANAGKVSGISNTAWQLTRGSSVVASSEESSRFIVLPQSDRIGTLLNDVSLQPGQYTLKGTFGTDDGGEPPVVLNPQPFTKTFTVE